MDALREAQKQSFCASFLLKVTFFGESSIDDGGPRREFFRLLVLQAGESLLRGDNIKFFSLNVPALVQRQYYHLGVLVAMSILQGGCGIPCLSSSVYNYIAYGTCTSAGVNSCDIPDLSLRDTVERVIASTLLDDLKAVFNEDGPRMLLMECGYFAPSYREIGGQKDYAVFGHCVIQCP
ncbi:hypothetical protein EMCRGX_G034735 [Ephydatia muelleri]